MSAYPIKLAALDIAGTTIDEGHAVYRSLEDAVQEAGGTPSPDDIRRWMGADKREAITGLLGDPGSDRVEEVFDRFRRLLLDAYAVSPPVPLPGVPEAIRHLRGEGVAVVLTTGFSREVTDVLLDVVGWANPGEVIDAAVSAEEVGAGRPAPYLIFEAMRRTHVQDVRAVLAAGDTVLDLRAGMNAGCGLVVGVLSGAQTIDQLGPEPHTHLLAGVAEIPALLAATPVEG